MKTKIIYRKKERKEENKKNVKQRGEQEKNIEGIKNKKLTLIEVQTHFMVKRARSNLEKKEPRAVSRPMDIHPFLFPISYYFSRPRFFFFTIR